MNKYRRYQLKRSQMTDEELLFENLRLNKVLEHAFWRCAARACQPCVSRI